MRGPRPLVQHELTAAQARLLERHERGLRRLADTLAAKNGMRPADIMFVIADRRGLIGKALSAALSTPAIGAVVLPGRAVELAAWVECLAMHGPVWELRRSLSGMPTIVIDSNDVMAVVRLVEHSP